MPALVLALGGLFLLLFTRLSMGTTPVGPCGHHVLYMVSVQFMNRDLVSSGLICLHHSGGEPPVAQETFGVVAG